MGKEKQKGRTYTCPYCGITYVAKNRRQQTCASEACRSLNRARVRRLWGKLNKEYV